MKLNMDVTRQETLCAPGSGTVRDGGGSLYIIDFADEENGDIVSPTDGIVTRIGDSGNRISIRTSSGISVSVGIGGMHPGRKNTAEGCHFYVREGDAVNAGQRLMHAGLSKIRRLGGDAECVMTVDKTDGLLSAVSGGASVRAGVTPLLRMNRSDENLSV